MRIIDWSSDVCPSDLFHRRYGVAPACQLLAAQAADETDDLAGGEKIYAPFETRPGKYEYPFPEMAERRHDDQPSVDHSIYRAGVCQRFEQIGRASCRERVCQYVYISVVAVSLKKK